MKPNEPKPRDPALKPLPSIALGLLAAATLSLTAHAGKAFDASIKNNSLAVSPDEHLAAVCYSDADRVVIYDLAACRPLKTLTGFVTPRNIVFAPDGKRFYVSDSSLGTVNVVDATSFETVARYPVGYGAFGTTLSALLVLHPPLASTAFVLWGPR